ncbi:MAG TPA: acVLRF1 family peptidyl-tRNA hydrolase [Pseudonocardiaceae bacterium]
MSKVREASGGGTVVEVPADRVAGWFDRFGARHGGIAHTDLAAGRVAVLADDGASAELAVPFGPLPLSADEPAGRRPGLVIGPLVEHLSRSRRIGLVLVRLGGHSVGVTESGRIVVSATDRKPVHGRSAAGGWSQQRFARRRAGQARVALRAAADDIHRVLGPRTGELDAVLLGGDRRALDELRGDPRLAPVFALALPRVLDVPEPRRAGLDEAAVRATGVEILVREPQAEPAAEHERA